MPSGRLLIPEAVLRDTFMEHRRCGEGQRECQVLWVGPWSDPLLVTKCVHPQHLAHRGGFELDREWLHRFWVGLAQSGSGVRVQSHTHPDLAFHSATDDAWPIVHTAGFLSLVIPRFATGPVGFEGAYLTELSGVGEWHQVSIAERIEVLR